MQDALQIGIRQRTNSDSRVFVATIVSCIVAAALFASWMPLTVSIVTVFLFAGPHNLAELRYFLTRLPARFGKSRNFFITAFAGLGFLTATYISLPLVHRATFWSNEQWLTLIAVWNSLLLGWIGVLVWQRSRQKRGGNWFWFGPVALALGALNWFTPDLFSLGLVYAHPLVALWFLDRHLQRNRPNWLSTYRRCLILVPVILVLMIIQLSSTDSLSENNGLFWRITQHSGAELLPNVSSHLLVSVHLFLEILHYGVWVVALTLISKPGKTTKPWDLSSIPLVRHRRGFPKTIAVIMLVAVAVVTALWFGFSIDYSTTRDIYFTLAIAHVIAEAPFLLRML